MIYRILQRVDKGGAPGSLCRFEWLDAAQGGRLVTVGAIAPVQAPPLAVLPGWTRRAALLRRLGIERADDFLEANADALAPGLKVKPETVQRWQAEVTVQLTVPRRTGR